MRPYLKVIDYQETPLGPVMLRKRRMMTLDDLEIFEIMLGADFLMSSLFTVVEEALSTLGVAATEKIFPKASESGDLRVVVGGLGLGYTAKVVLDHLSVGELIIVDYLKPVIEWHKQGLVPLGTELSQDARCSFEHGDFFKRAVSESGVGFDSANEGKKFHAILLDIDHSPAHLLNEQHAAFYSVEGLGKMAQQLEVGGVFGLWSDDPPEASFLGVLSEVFENCETHIVPFYNPILERDSESTVYVCY